MRYSRTSTKDWLVLRVRLSVDGTGKGYRERIPTLPLTMRKKSIPQRPVTPDRPLVECPRASISKKVVLPFESPWYARVKCRLLLHPPITEISKRV